MSAEQQKAVAVAIGLVTGAIFGGIMARITIARPKRNNRISAGNFHIDDVRERARAVADRLKGGEMRRDLSKIKVPSSGTMAWRNNQ